jgi:hypothetical protein
LHHNPCNHNHKPTEKHHLRDQLRSTKHCLLLDIERLSNDTNNSGTVVVEVRHDLERLGSLVPRGLMGVLLSAGATATTKINGDTEDADASTGTGSLLELGVESAGG